MQVLGISGSLRAASYNSKLLHEARRLAPEGFQLEVVTLEGIPLFNEDVEAAGFPGPVRELREKIAAADAVLISTPEYNSSIPGVLKNAIDWVSRKPAPPLAEKPTVILGATTGGYGTIRSQTHLRGVLGNIAALLPPKPEFFLSKAADQFDPEGRLSLPASQAQLQKFLAGFAAWVERVGGPRG